jgi:Spy/CpxP family protein refolding chaperone
MAVVVAAGGLIIFNTQAAQDDGAAGLRARVRSRAAEKLNLSKGQRAQIRTILKADKEALTGLFHRLHDARTGLRETIQASGTTEDSVRAAAARVAAVEADLAVERLKLYGKISPVLTADQRRQLNEWRGRADDAVDKLINRFGESLAE